MTNLPNFLKRTPEQIRDEANRQQILRDLHAKGSRQTPAEQRFGMAILKEQAIRANLELIERGTDVYRETKLQLAEALAEQGRFEEAAKTAKGSDIAVEYKSLASAINKDDSKTCKCQPEQIQGRNARGEAVMIDIPPACIVMEVYSTKHGKIVPVVKCSKCGFVNATEENTPDLEPLTKHEEREK